MHGALLTLRQRRRLPLPNLELRASSLHLHTSHRKTSEVGVLHRLRLLNPNRRLQPTRTLVDGRVQARRRRQSPRQEVKPRKPVAGSEVVTTCSPTFGNELCWMDVVRSVAISSFEQTKDGCTRLIGCYKLHMHQISSAYCLLADNAANGIPRGRESHV